MAEVGCLKDGHFQNLQVEGKLDVAVNPQSGVEITQFTGVTNAIDDGASEVTTLTNADHGSIVKWAFDFSTGETSIINLPATVVNGFHCRIVLTADPTHNGVGTIRTNVAGNRLLTGSVIVASTTHADSACANAIPATNDTSLNLVFTGATSNCDFAAGSVIDVVGIASATTAPGYLLTGYVLGLGTGTGGAIAFT
jgi:hypothetical protein